MNVLQFYIFVMNTLNIMRHFVFDTEFTLFLTSLSLYRSYHSYKIN